MDYPTKENFRSFSPETLTQICYSNSKLEDKILIENILVINKLFSSLLPQIFSSPSAMIFIILKQSHPLLIKCLNHHIELILTEKNAIEIGNL